MIQQNEYFPQAIPHPGSTLEEELEAMGMSIKEFAIRTNKPEKTIIAVIKGKSAITQEMAIKFENVTRIKADFWIRFQNKYDEYKTREKINLNIGQAAEWAMKFPYSEMAKLNWVPPTQKINEKTINLFSYFGISSSEAWTKLYMENNLKVAAYASLKHTLEPHAISAWLRNGEIQAATIETPEYDKKKFENVLFEIKKIMQIQPKDFFVKLQQLCLNAGVKLIYTNELPKVLVNASTRWLSNTPLIQLTARYKQNDHFWFTFFHEAGHILLHGKKYISLENIDFKDTDPDKEQQAHEFAENWTFSKKQEQEFIATSDFSEKNIILYAKKFETHPSMIIGRLQQLELLPFLAEGQFIVPIDLDNAKSANSVDASANSNIEEHKIKRYFGGAKHIVKRISDDFTAPIPEFEEYMPTTFQKF